MSDELRKWLEQSAHEIVADGGETDVDNLTACLTELTALPDDAEQVDVVGILELARRAVQFHRGYDSTLEKSIDAAIAQLQKEGK